MGARDQFAPIAVRKAKGPSDEFEYKFLQRDFERVRRLIYQRAGISLSEQKHNMVYSRLSRRLRFHGIASFTQYLDRLEAGGQFGAAEWQEFINSLTTNLTSFFREPHHFAVLEEFLRSSSTKEPPRIWCAAASTGEEAYSIAITMAEAAGTASPGSLLATDIDTKVLASAKQATYALEAAQVCGAKRLRRFFLRGAGSNEGKVRVRPELVRLIQFAPLNLRDERWPRVQEFSSRLDVVFCRNVMIYFDRKTQKEILQRIVEVLRPGGLLFVGHSENFTECTGSLSLRGKTVYQRN